MPSPPKGKRVQTNDHPGLIGKKTRRTKAEVAAENAAKEAKETADAATEERVLTKLAEIELEQEKTEAVRRKAVIHKHSAIRDSVGTPGEDSVQADMDTGEDLTELMDEEMKEIDEDESDQDNDEITGRVKKVSYTTFTDRSQLIHLPSRSPDPKREHFCRKSPPERRTFNSLKWLRRKSGMSHVLIQVIHSDYSYLISLVVAMAYH
jgi:hypothetical protein